MKRNLSALLALVLVACSTAEASPLGSRLQSGMARTPPGGEEEIPLPNDATIFGSLSDGAMYIARVEDLACDGAFGDCTDGETVETWRNADNAGTRDITFSPAPTFEDGGSNGKSYVHCDGVNDEGVATGYSYVADTNDEPFVLAVGRFHTNGAPGIAVGLSDGDDGSEFALGMQQRTTIWRWNGNFANTPHNVDGASAGVDTAWHAFGLLVYASTGFRGDLDGTLDADVGGTGGIIGTLDTLFICVGPTGTGDFGQADIHEIVITEGRTQTEYDNYLALRVEPEYAIDTN